MKKRLLSALCAVMLLICAVPMASAQTGDAARRADALTVLHLLSEDPSRDLTKPATRAQAAVLLVRLASGEKKPDTDGWFAGFRDVPDWARTAVNYANRRGWISGVSNVQFNPNGHLNADAWCAMLLRMLGYSDKTGDFEISDAAAFAWRIGLTGRQLIGILSMGDLAESIYDALDFCYKGTETTVLSRLMDLGVCTASAANALGLLNKDYTARQLADRYLSAAFQLSLYETEEQVHDEVSSADASGFFICAMCFGAAMKASGMLHHLASMILPMTKRRVSLVTSTVVTGTALNGIVSDQYLAIILTSSLFKDIYEKEGYENRLLSRAVEDSATVTSPLYPWSSCGMTQATILNVPTMAYLPYCFFNLLSPLMSVTVAVIGYKIFKTASK